MSKIELMIQGSMIEVSDDAYSDRVRCDHPLTLLEAQEELSPKRSLEVGKELGRELGSALMEVAERQARGRVVTFVPTALESGLVSVGFEREALIPSFYDGEGACAVLGAYPTTARNALAHPKERAKVMGLLSSREERAQAHQAQAHQAQLHQPQANSGDGLQTRLAQLSDAEQLAALLGDTFNDYPTPSDDPEYLRAQMQAGTPFRLAEEGGELIACASADLVVEAKTAELTDCATRPHHRGRGLMKRLLNELCSDLERLGYPTAFTLARARIPGVNLAFHGLGFELHGCMSQSCRIGDGLEDMHVWSKRLSPSVTPA